MGDIRQGFLSAILAEPHEDAHRLAFSDWLKEHGQEPDDAQRGEFIRLQVELHNLGECARIYPDAVHTLYPFCRGCMEAARLYPQMEALWYEPARGFAGEIPQGCAATIGEPETMCSQLVLAVRRGFAWAASGPLNVLLRDLPAIMHRQPIEEVRVTDKKPSDYTNSDAPVESHFSWWKDWYRSYSVWNLPTPIWDALDGFLSREELVDHVVDNARDYRTEADAMNALNRAAWKLCRKEAGLWS